MVNVLFSVYVSAMSYMLFREKNEIKIVLHICVISKLKKNKIVAPLQITFHVGLT